MLGPCGGHVTNAEPYAFHIPLLNIVSFLHVLELNIDLPV